MPSSNALLDNAGSCIQHLPYGRNIIPGIAYCEQMTFQNAVPENAQVRDTGCGANAGQGMWTSGAGSVRDTMGKPLEEKIKNTDGLIEIVKSKKYARMMVSARTGAERVRNKQMGMYPPLQVLTNVSDFHPSLSSIV
jgi:hypothetical protein